MTIVGTAEVELRGESGQFRSTMNAAARHFQGVGRMLEDVGAQLTRRVTLPLLALGGGALMAGVKMDTLRRSLLAVAGSSEEAERQMTELREVAKLPGLGFAEAIQGSVRLQAVGMSAAVAMRSLKAFGNAIATTGGGKAELERLTVQLGQLSAKGKILAQDLRPIIEVAPVVGKALKDAFGTVDAAEIEALGLTTEQFLDRLLTQLETLPKVTGGPKIAFENLQDALLRAGDAISATFLPIVGRLADRLAGLLESLSKVNPEILEWGVAIAGALIVMGPLLSMITRITTAVSILATGLSIGMLPLLATGGALFVGLGLLATLFIKNKLAAEDTAPAVMSLADAFKTLNQEVSGGQIIDAMFALQDARDKLAARPLLDAKTKRQLAAIDIQLAALRDKYLALGKAASKKLPPLTPPKAGDKSDFDDYVQGLTKAVALGIASREEQIQLRQIMVQQRDIGHGLVGTAEERVKALERARDAADALLIAARQEIALPTPMLMPNMGVVFGPAMSAAAERAAASVKHVSEVMQEFGLLAVDTAMRAGDAFVDFAFGAKDAFHNFARAALSDLARILARIAILETLQALFPGSKVISAIAGRASGGPVMQNQPYLVGERGPELFVPRSTGRIIPDARGAGARPLVLDFSRFPAAANPLAAARDDAWMRFLKESLANAYEDGNLYLQRG